ncbi:flagellar protein FliT [Candidatus Pacearchaeota archaeon]|nr:flagellar protein FliT [Candidatus Pacearchaeota archaeon]
MFSSSSAVQHIQEAALRKIIIFSQEMLIVAKQHEWEALTEMSVDRQKMLESFFEKPIAEHVIENIQTGLKQIMSIDQDIVKLADASRDEATHQLSQLSTSRHAVNEYTNNGVE